MTRPWVPILLALAVIAPQVPAGAGAPSGTFKALEADLRGQIAVTTAGLQRDPGSEGKLESLYGILHNLRNYPAFQELWKAWGWSKPELEVLYVGSGSHIAPLVFLENSTLKRARFTFTEVDPLAPGRVQAMLRLMQERGVYSGLTASWAPAAEPALDAAWKSALAGVEGEALRTRLEAFVPWYGRAVEATNRNPGFEVRFAFRAGGCAVEIHMLIGMHEMREGSTSFYRLSDLERADLFVTHDWDSASLGNLQVLISVLESYPRTRQEKRLAVMMEDLEKHPFPVHMDIFNPVARSSAGYGHVEYVYLPGGRRLLFEDGKALYGGGVILQPDTSFLGSLPPDRLETLFNLALFTPCLLNRGNVDVIGGKRVVAPAILDAEVGYGYRDIRGNDLRRDGSFPRRLAEAALGLVNGPPQPPSAFLAKWCALLKEYGEALERGAHRDVRAVLSCDPKGAGASPFLGFQKARQKFDLACAHRLELVSRLEAEKGQYREAAAALDPKLSTACVQGGTGQSPRVGSERKVPVPGATGLRGRTLRGPMCPGPVRPDHPCPDQAFSTAVEVLDGAGKRVALVRSGEDGAYEVALPPGAYRVVLSLDESAPAFQRAGVKPSEVTVVAGQMAVCDLRLDTGMR